ncbi:efflux RND transporter periplasmic adaptor subunit [Hymenobacter crusticola]|uniref:RND efflux pump membrane fusion protein barrel-sandwich domain-containing protein n=1 Tax=Hymenobacter crusticola TaxID=1770526 RepID=A0A243W8Q0_9BACT|nr:hypothetical protein [Hymenobacter crusticola]OUJ71740.1 hypothetical protein BXP70_20490 [Hymenobacter crusticola]
MKLLATLSFFLFLVVGTAFPLWLPVQEPLSTAKATSVIPSHQDLAGPVLAGELIGFVSTPVMAPVTGIVLETYFYEGQFVHKGQVLVKLWVRAANGQEYVSAPKDGVITHFYARIRELWPVAKPILTLADPTQLHVRLKPSSPASVSHFHAHDNLYVQLATSSSATVPGKVAQLDFPAKAPATLRVHLAKPLAGARPGSALFITSAAGPVLKVSKKIATSF